MKLLVVFRHYREDLYASRSRDPNKKRPTWFSNALCLKSILIAISKINQKHQIDLLIWYDGSQEDLNSDPILALITRNEYAAFTQVVLIDYKKQGSNSSERLSFPQILEFVRSRCVQQYIYLVENDYLHHPRSLEALIKIFDSRTDVEYLNLADHKDYYHLPIHLNYQNIWSYTEDFLIRTNATTTGTFAARLEVITNDMPIIINEPDFVFFNKLTGIYGRSLWTTVPSLAAHCMQGMLPPAVNWDELAERTMHSA